MATGTVTGADVINNLSSQYKAREVNEDPMGKTAFLTMLIAQLKNQDPLSPMEGTDFTAQLAQFSQLENTLNTNTTLEKILDAVNGGEDSTDYVGYIGKTVTGDLSTINVSDGDATKSYYSLKESGEVVVAVKDSKGNEIRRVYLGQQTAGTHDFTWDGKDTDNNAAVDGTYTYDVLVLGAGGYAKQSTAVTGEVTGVSYQNGKKYLEVSVDKGTKTILLDPSTVSKVNRTETASAGTGTTAVSETDAAD